ncbi:hypothetical protein M8C21_013365, partial [Ambrosia artemisiifolia]
GFEEHTTSSRSFFDLELWHPAIRQGQSGQRGQPGIPEPSFLLDPLELSLGLVALDGAQGTRFVYSEFGEHSY